MTDYCLKVRYLSNERPWSGTHSPYPEIDNDQQAIVWAGRMAKELWDYEVTLMKEGRAFHVFEGRAQTAPDAPESRSCDDTDGGTEK